MKINTKGMTLIEITVVLVISSIILLIAGTIILNGFGYFDKTDKADKDKLAVDSIAEIVRDELVYATDVRIETPATKPSDAVNVSEHEKWHWISVDEKGHLNKDDKPLYGDDFYQNRKLKITVRLYTNDYRLDLGFRFIDKDSKEVYSTSNTLELINMKSSLSNETTTHVSTELANNSASDYRIYYRNGVNGFVNNKPGGDDPDISGTVADEENCIDVNTNVVKWIAGKNEYPKGSFVRYPDNESGIWYRATQTMKNSSKPDTNPQGTWKAITSYWISTSTYLKDDVIEFPRGSEIYYQCLTSHGSNKLPTEHEYWKRLSDEEHDLIVKEHASDSFCSIKDDINDKTVGGEAKRCMGEYGLVEWKTGAVVNQGGYVSYNGKVYRYINAGSISYDSGQFPQVEGYGAVWKLIDSIWNPNTYYAKYDIIQFNGDGKWYQAMNIITPGFSPHTANVGWSAGYNSLEELIKRGDFKEPSCEIYR